VISFSRKVGGELPELPIDSGKLSDTPVDRKDGLRGRQISIWVSDKSGGYFCIIGCIWGLSENSPTPYLKVCLSLSNWKQSIMDLVWTLHTQGVKTENWLVAEWLDMQWHSQPTRVRILSRTNLG
jgi:hypothetical protein